MCLKDPCEIESFQLCHKTLALEIFYIDVTTEIYNRCCQCFAQIRELEKLSGPQRAVGSEWSNALGGKAERSLCTKN